MQTAALLVDSFRLLLARKLFWITLAISGLVMLAYASMGFHANGISLVFGLWKLDLPEFAEGTALGRALYVGVFTSFIVPIWLAWVATILALVSTTSIFPDFLSDGAVDVVLAKPVSRTKIFLVKYLGSLLFVLLQVGVFCIGVFVAMGLRLGEWNWALFAAVPLITVFYSYIYCVNALIGVLTRSAIAALLGALLFWFAIFIVQSAEGTLTQFVTQTRVEHERAVAQAESLDARVERLRNPANMREHLARNTLTPEGIEARITQFERNAEVARANAAGKARTLQTLETWRGRVRVLLTVLPRTSATIALLDRWLTPDGDATMLDVMLRATPTAPSPEPPGDDAAIDDLAAPTAPPDTSTRHGPDEDVLRRLDQQQRAEPAWRIIGPSLAFEAFILLIACAVFTRKDF